MPHVLAHDLRNAVLQAAFEGRLTTQKHTDSNVFDVLKSNSISKYTEETPFDIPNSWVWVKFGDISTYTKTKKKINAQNANPDTWMLDMEDIEKGGRLLVKKKVSERKAIGDKTVFSKGNILYSKLRPYLLKVLIADEDGICTPELVPFNMLGETSARYTVYYLKSPYVDDVINRVTYGVKMPRVGTDTMKDLYFPLPPIEEQTRIVARVDELMVKIDEYEKIEKELVELHKSFPGDMKDAILQAAMQGKLSEQLDSDTPQKVKPDSFEDEDSLLDIPVNWQWNQLGSVVDIMTGLSFSKQEQCNASNDALRILRGGNILDNYKYRLFDNDVYVAYRDKYIKLEIGDVLSPSVTSMEKMCKVAYIDKELLNTTAGGFVYILRSKDCNIINPKYLMYFFNSNFNRQMCKPNIHKSGQAFYNLKKSGLVTQPIPIPPIEDQQRLVEKLDKLLPLINSIESDLR